MKMLLKTVIIDNIIYEIYGPSNDKTDKFDEVKNLFKELERLWGFLNLIEKTLNNKSFIEKEIRKFNDTINKILSVEDIIYNYLILKK